MAGVGIMSTQRRQVPGCETIGKCINTPISSHRLEISAGSELISAKSQTLVLFADRQVGKAPKESQEEGSWLGRAWQC